MPAPRGEPLSGADSAWWRMDRPDNPMVITAVLVFDTPLEFARLRAAVEARLLAHPRFRQRVAEPRFPWGPLAWVDDAAFSLDNHVRRLPLPAPRDEAALQSLVGREMSRPLDRDRPPWRMDLVESYRGGSVLVARLHHAIADGLALLHVLLGLDDVPGNEQPESLGAIDGLLRRNHATPGSALVRAAEQGLRSVPVLGRLLLGRGDAAAGLRGPLGTEKVAAWSRPFPLEGLRGAAHLHGCTVHDLLAAVVAGGVGRYLDAQGELNPRVHAVVPVNLRRADEWGELGNRFGLVFLPLPVDLRDLVRRLEATRDAMNALKHSTEAGVMYLALRVFGRLGSPLLDLAVMLLARRASLVLTDVPGPRGSIRMCGARLQSLMAWVPQAGPLGLGVAVLSYAGDIRVGVAADARLTDAPAMLVAACERELSTLVARAPAPPAALASV